MSLQKGLFEKLKPLIPAEQSLAEYIGGILFLSSDSVYRRLRGETQLTIDELKTICQHFGLSSDALLELGKKNEIKCEVSSMGDRAPTFIEFIGGIDHQLSQVMQLGNARVIYSGKDIPLFYNLMFPGLFAFKYHLWMQVFARSADFVDKEFDPRIKDAELTRLANNVMQKYNAIPCIEIWNSENINSLLFQIDFYKYSKYFGGIGQISSLYDEVDEMLMHLEKQAEAGCKFLPGENPDLKPDNYKMYYNQVSLSDNIILVRAGDLRKTFINYSVLNFITTHDHAFCRETEDHLENIVRRSTQLSRENVKMRSIFFNNQHERVESYRKKL